MCPVDCVNETSTFVFNFILFFPFTDKRCLIVPRDPSLRLVECLIENMYVAWCQPHFLYPKFMFYVELIIYYICFYKILQIFGIKYFSGEISQIDFFFF